MYMKKWYKKHLDELKAVNKQENAEKISRYSFDIKKSGPQRSYPSPVAASKLQRSKTDSR